MSQQSNLAEQSATLLSEDQTARARTEVVPASQPIGNPLAPKRAPAARQDRALLRPEACGGVLRCPHKAIACPALTQLFGPAVPSMGNDELSTLVARIAPCGSCRVSFDSRRASLRGLRLGQRERDVLIGASSSEVYAVTAKGMTRSMSAARRRAAQSLIKSGLVAPAKKKIKGRATIALTDLGRYVMLAYGRFIEAGKPVRWDRPLAKIPVPGREPVQLLDEALSQSQAAMRETLDELKKVLIAAVVRPVRDSQALDNITQHLQNKADVLRGLIEPASRPQPVLVK